MANTAKEVVAKAKSYLGTTDGSIFVKHYNERTGIGLPLNCAWCACFVSDIMRMCGVLQESVKDYKGCTTGVEWFTAQGRFKSRQSGYIPKPGDIIFYEWNPQNEGTGRDDGADHTGIVEYVESGCVNTIEGNSGKDRKCDSWVYPLDYKCIEGYGIPLYNIGENEPVKPAKPPINKTYKVMVTPSDGLNCRSGAGTGYGIVTAYPCGTELVITVEKDGWGKTDKGWVCLQYTKASSSKPVAPPSPSSSKYTTGTYKVTADVLNVRTGAGTNYDWISFNDLSDNARSQIKNLSGYAANGYVKGMVCDVSQVSGNWGRTPSGWICLDYATKI